MFAAELFELVERDERLCLSTGKGPEGDLGDEGGLDLEVSEPRVPLDCCRTGSCPPRCTFRIGGLLADDLSKDGSHAMGVSATGEIGEGEATSSRRGTCDEAGGEGDEATILF